jgi:hypothetical protein
VIIWQAEATIQHSPASPITFGISQDINWNAITTMPQAKTNIFSPTRCATCVKTNLPTVMPACQFVPSQLVSQSLAQPSYSLPKILRSHNRLSSDRRADT